MVELLLGEGADPTIASKNGTTPLMTASRHGHLGVVRCLLHHPQALSTLNHRDWGRWTALYHACCKKGDHDAWVREPLEAGADPTITTDKGETAMGRARREGRYICVELLEVREWGLGVRLGKEGGRAVVRHMACVPACMSACCRCMRVVGS